MLSNEQLKPFLLNPDSDIRAHVANYFACGRSEDDTLTPLIIQATETYGLDTNLHCLSCISDLPMSEREFLRVVQWMEDRPSADAASSLGRVIAEAPIELLLRHEPRLARCGRIMSECGKRLRRRFQVAEWPAERLWARLRAIAEWGNENARWVNEIDHDEAHALLRALASHSTPSDDELRQLLTDPAVNETWLEIFVIQLAGQRRLGGCTDALVDKLHIDTDYMLERVNEALARIGDVAAAHRIGDAWPTAESGFKIFAADLLSKLRHPDVEQIVINVLEQERDQGNRTVLCQALLDLLSLRGLDLVRDQIESGYGEIGFDLETELLTVATILGVSVPDEAELRARIERRRQSSKNRWSRLLESFDVGKGELTDAGDAENTDTDEIDPADDPLVGEPVRTIRRVDPRVGRNDKCPCGSGKKYKHCCGRN